MTPERVASHQKARLEGAMVEAVARHGFAGTTLRELVALAGVSKSTFYEHFDSKQDCFLSTFDEIVAEVGERVGQAYREHDDFRTRLVAALAAFMDMAVAEPAAARLAAVESLTLGAAGVAHRERGSQAFELMIAQSFEHSPSPGEVPAMTVRAIVGGVRGVVYRRLRAGHQADLPGLVPELVDWALRYQEPDSEAVARACAAAAEPAPLVQATGDEEGGEAEKPGWSEPPDSPRSRAELSQRERIVRAAARVVVEKGYEALSIPTISATAGTSNQTFYEHFRNKRDAFIAAFEILSGQVLAASAAAFATAGDRPEAIGVGLRAMLENIAADELFARLAFFELPTAGPAALDFADTAMDAFTAYLTPELRPSGIPGSVSGPILEAIGSGIWAAIQHEIAHGRTAELPAKAPEITRIALAPLG
ncbi:MAG TPA: TetR/AcrR family transcriptional regulator [Solirubrobacterales bacterium]|nr:TetR/AcrR family transcriptional regulator [Solirubrobacterales bacterium]